VRTVAGLLLVMIAVCSAGCSTHEPRFEEGLPSPPSRLETESGTAAGAAGELIRRYETKTIVLPVESLAALARASALMFDVTGAPGMQAVARSFTDTLLKARVPVGSGQAFFSSRSRGRPDLEATIDAGNALLDVFRLTRDTRYVTAARDAGQAVISKRLGFVSTSDGFAVAVQGAHPGLYSIPLTAGAALFLQRLAVTQTRPTALKYAQGAFEYVAKHQAAVGRWYLLVGAKTPMTLRSWAGTLLALASTSDARNQGIVGGGVAGLWSAAFTNSGSPRRGPLFDRRGLGLALSLRLFQRFASSSREADATYRSIFSDRRSDGTVEEAPSRDDVAQAYYALAFAERAFALRYPDRWKALRP
jgi:hypothetical protein